MGRVKRVAIDVMISTFEMVKPVIHRAWSFSTEKILQSRLNNYVKSSTIERIEKATSNLSENIDSKMASALKSSLKHEMLYLEKETMVCKQRILEQQGFQVPVLELSDIRRSCIKNNPEMASFKDALEKNYGDTYPKSDT